MSATLADLPTIAIPDSYALEMPSFLARMAAEHGPIFKRDWGGGQAMTYYSPVGFIATGVELRVVPRQPAGA